MNPADLPLRDIHLPTPISWWPPAMGWWLLLGLSVGLGIALLIWQKKRATRLKPVNSALAELERIERDYQGDPFLLAQELSVLLRRTAISLYGQEIAAGLTGLSWLNFLDEKAGKRLFVTDIGKVLSGAIYDPHARIDTLILMKTVRAWIIAQKRQVG